MGSAIKEGEGRSGKRGDCHNRDRARKNSKVVLLQNGEWSITSTIIGVRPHVNRNLKAGHILIICVIGQTDSV